jgi:Flp pilus assembly pilin Flp
MKALKKLALGFFADETGQGTVEWVLITALVVVAIMILIYAFRDQIKAMMQKATDTMSSWSQ